MTEAEHRKVDKANPEDVEPGEILVDKDGNVVIGVPSAVAQAVAPEPGGGDDD
jgi:hypothetical protein